MQVKFESRIVTMNNSNDLLIMMGDRIKSRRVFLGITQRELAGACNIEQGLLSKYERGEVEPKTIAFMKIANALGVSLEWLLGLDDSPAPLPKELDEEEKELLAIYRAKPGQQDKILAMARML